MCSTAHCGAATWNWARCPPPRFGAVFPANFVQHSQTLWHLVRAWAPFFGCCGKREIKCSANRKRASYEPKGLHTSGSDCSHSFIGKGDSRRGRYSLVLSTSQTVMYAGSTRDRFFDCGESSSWAGRRVIGSRNCSRRTQHRQSSGFSSLVCDTGGEHTHLTPYLRSAAI